MYFHFLLLKLLRFLEELSCSPVVFRKLDISASGALKSILWYPNKYVLYHFGNLLKLVIYLLICTLFPDHRYIKSFKEIANRLKRYNVLRYHKIDSQEPLAKRKKKKNTLCHLNRLLGSPFK